MPPGGEEEARAFYGGLLGLTEVKKPEALAEAGGCWFEGPGTAIHVGVDRAFTPATRAHPAFRVLDLGALHRTLEGAGVPVTLPGDREDLTRFFATDPFGNRVEFIQAD